MSKNNIKLIMENWNNFVNEAPKDPQKAKDEILKKIKDDIAAAKKAGDKDKVKKLEKKLNQKKAELAGPSDNPDQKKPVKEQAFDSKLASNRPVYKMEGKFVIATIKYNGKEYVGKARIRMGNIGRAKVRAAADARNQISRAISSEPAPK